jgi:hypothetical protein
MQKQKNKQKQKQVLDLVQLIDNSYILDIEIKEKKKVLETNKDKLKDLAKIEGKNSLLGDLGECSFSDTTTTEIDPEAFYKLLVELELDHEFFSLVTVKITDAKAKIGEMALSTIWKQETKKNNTIKFKKRM